MSNSKLNRIKLILIASLLAVCCFWAGIVMMAKAEPAIATLHDVTTFGISETSLLVEGEDGANGLQFTASMSADEYEELTDLVGEGKTYVSMETGLIIMPANYIVEYGYPSEENLFGYQGVGAVYDWAEWDSNEYNYVYSGDKVRVININANSWVKGEGVYTYSGAIIDVLEHNEDTTFVSIAYVLATDVNGISSFITTDLASANIAIEVAKAKADDTLTKDQLAWVDANWKAWETIDLGENLIDVTGKEEIDMSEFVGLDNMTDEEMFKIGFLEPTSAVATDVNGNKMELLEEPTLAINDKTTRLWNIEIKLGDVVLCKAVNDIVDKNAKLVWNTIDEDGLKSFKGYYPTSVLNVLPTVNKAVSSFDGKTTFAVTGLKNWAGNAPGEAFFNLLPVHSKAYYELYLDKGISMDLSMYFETDITPASGKYIVNQGAIGYNNGIMSTPAANKWHTKPITMETIVEQWDIIVNAGGTYTWGSRDDLSMFYALMTDHKPSENLVYHFSGFNFTMDVSGLSANGGDILVELDNADETALDLTSYMKKEDADILQTVGAVISLTYEMKGYSIADTITVTDLTKVDVSNASHGAYILKVKTGDTVLYTATFDLYSTTDEVVWATELTEYNVLARRTANFQIGTYYTETVKASGTVPYEIVDTFTEGTVTGKGSFAKFTVNEPMNIAFDIKPLHTKTYYNATIGDTTKLLMLRAWISSAAGGKGIQVLDGRENYLIHNVTKIKGRFGIAANTLHHIALSLDNNFLATSASDINHKYYYDYWQTLEGDNLGNCRPMITFEVDAAQIDATNGFVCYVGFHGKHIVDGGETLAHSPAVTEIDMTATSSYDLINLIPTNQHAKYKAMSAAWIGKKISCCGKNIKGNGLAFVLTINGSTHVVVPDAEGKTMLNLDDYVIDQGGTVSTTVKVRDLLTSGANSVKIAGFALPATLTIGHSTQMMPSSTITITI